MEALTFIPVATAGQIDTLATLAKEVWTEHYASILAPEQVEYMVETFQSAAAVERQLREQGYRYYLVCRGGRPAGYMGLQPGEGKLFLSKLYLLKEARGRGFARQMLAFMEGYCRALNLSAIWLTVNRHNSGSIAAYEKMGFATVREQKADIGNGFVMDDFVMEKPVLGGCFVPWFYRRMY